jgi:23S rRNA pseudouridine1911/1915/1917 synthase
MVVARTLGAQIDLVKQLQDRSVSRIYRAIVEGNPHKEGIINKNIGRDMNNRLRMTTLEFGGREAITRYRVLKQFKSISYIECKLETGRTHQIRVHMKDRGHSLIGDPVYGTRKINYSPEVVNAIEELKRQALHAIKLSFIHPETKEPIHFKSRLAEDMRNLLKALSLDEEVLIDEDWDMEDDGRKINYSPEVVNAIEELKRQALHAIKLSFIHPETKEPIHFKSRLAEDMRNLLKALSLDEEVLIDEDWDMEDDGNWEVIYAYDH